MSVSFYREVEAKLAQLSRKHILNLVNIKRHPEGVQSIEAASSLTEAG